MKKILLCCAAGMSTSLLVKKMQIAAAERGLDVEIWSEPLEGIEKEIKKADVFLLGPQVKFAFSDLKLICDSQNIPIDVISMLDYGMMNGVKVLDLAMNMIS